MASPSQNLVLRTIPRIVGLGVVFACLLAGSMGRAAEPEAVPSEGTAADPATPKSDIKSPTSAEKHWQERPLGKLKATRQHTEGELPPNHAAGHLTDAARLSDPFSDTRPWVMTNYEWEAPATRHLPLLFEEPNLERLGYTDRCFRDARGRETDPSRAEFFQPVVSGAHFLGNVAIIPYRCGYQPVCEPVFTLGVDRPGSPVCYRKHHLPLSLRGAVYQAGVVTGLVFVIP